MKNKFFIYSTIALAVTVIVLSILLNRSYKKQPCPQTTTTIVHETRDTVNYHDTIIKPKPIYRLADSAKIIADWLAKNPTMIDTFGILLNYYTENIYDTIIKNDADAFIRLRASTWMNELQLLGIEWRNNRPTQTVTNTTVVNNFKNRIYLGLGVNYFWAMPKYPISVAGQVLFVTKKNLAIGAEVDPLNRYAGIRGYWKLSINRKK